MKSNKPNPNMINSLKINLLSFIVSIVATSVIAQEYPKGYFMFPIKPGQVNYLSGSMGELRSSHFHAGIDIKTDQRTGLPVYAAADGYVSRIKVSSFGYGNVLYITHPNKLVTVYAHLEEFGEEIKKYVLQEQYRQKSFNIELLPAPDMFQVQKGQIIAKSGNSGSSGGPHLHFEIRDEKENVLHPLLFGFTEIKDNIPPVVQKVALTTFNPHSRINQQYGRFEYSLNIAGNKYSVPNTIEAFGQIGIEVMGYDKMNGTHNKYGISCIEVKVNNEEVYYHKLHSFSFAETKCINSHINYETYVNQKERFEKCYIDDCNRLSSYKRNIGDGKISIPDSGLHHVEIRVYDIFNNVSTIQLKIKGVKPVEKPVLTIPLKEGYRISENTLIMIYKSPASDSAQLMVNNQLHLLSPSYSANGYNVFLYDLRKGLPRLVKIQDRTEEFNFATIVPPKRDIIVKYEDLRIKFADTTLFDTLYLQLKTGKTPDGKKYFEVGSEHTPLFAPVEIHYYPTDLSDTLHYRAYFMSGSKPTFIGGNWEKDHFKFHSKFLGKFILEKDTIGPEVKYLGVKGNSVKFNIFDKNSDIDSFTATLNGNWILMNYDHKTKALWSEVPDNTTPLKGNFRLEVKDASGNITVFETVIP
ncbi:MAG TPA: M23 family metallopeptidase [Cytophagaceae bacterium]